MASACGRTVRDRLDPRSGLVDAAVLGVVALLLRLPAFFASRHLSYDDGVYGVSVVDMRHGSRRTGLCSAAEGRCTFRSCTSAI